MTMVYGIFPEKQAKQSNLHPAIKKLAYLIINNDPSPSSNGIVRVDNTKAELAQYLSDVLTLLPVLSYVQSGVTTSPPALD